MTRILSELLGAREPDFRMGLLQLERAHGHPSSDIRLSTEVQQASQNKLRLLGLDPKDTTGQELYHMLQQRMQADDAKLEKTLRTLAATYVSAEGDVVAGMVHAIKQLPVDQSCFALKLSSTKALLKKQPPKKAMKQLGYRSLDSMLKHEHVASVLAAAWLTESDSWRKSYVEHYKSLTPRDFETRHVSIMSPSSPRWVKLANTVVSLHKHNLVALKELGAIVLLPLPDERPDGTTLATLVLALHALNDIRSTSSFLRLSQVKADFGRQVQVAACGEPHLQAHLFGQAVPWHLVQRYFAGAKHLFSEELFEPHVAKDDLSWHAIERLLSHIEPDLSFWHDSAHLALLHDHQPVSLNVLDVALNYCNKLPFARRLVHYSQGALWQELMLRYLNHDAVEAAVTGEMQPQLATEEILI